jgi:hypothetical protein
MSKSVNLDEDGLPGTLILPKIKEMSAEKVSPAKRAARIISNKNQPPLLHSVAMTK